jgi:predicted DNA-binding protein
MRNGKAMNIQLSLKADERLAEVARDAGISASDYVINLIVEHLEDMDDIASAEAVLRTDNGPYHTLEDVMRTLAEAGPANAKGEAAE